MNETEPQRQLNAALGRIASGLFILTARQGKAETGEDFLFDGGGLPLHC